MHKLKPAGVFGRNPEEEEDDQRTLLGEHVGGRKTGSSSSPTGQARRRSEGTFEGRGRAKTTKNTRGPAVGGLDGSSSFGDGAGSSSEDRENGVEDKRGGEPVGARGFDVPGGGVGSASGGRGGADASAGDIVDGKGNSGGGKKGGVRAMIRRRLRARKGSNTDGMSTVAEAVEGAASARGEFPPIKDGETQNYGTGGARVGISVDTSANIDEGPAEEASRNFLKSSGHDRSASAFSSSSSSSSSSSTSSSVFRTRPASTPDTVMRTPAGIWINRRGSREDTAEGNDRTGAVGGGSGAVAGGTGRGTDHGDELLLELPGTTRERVVGRDGGGGNTSP